MARHVLHKSPPAWRKLIPITAVVALLAGLFTTIDMPDAAAQVPGPGVAVADVDPPYVAGEDLDLDVTFTSADAAGDQYNLSAGMLLPADVAIVDTGSLGSPRVFTEGKAVPGAGECGAVGLEGTAGACTVPAEKQYLVFTNVSDLPEGAAATHRVTLRPNAETFGVGETIPVQVTGFTSTNERYIPAFPGTRSVADSPAYTSGPESDTEAVFVNALRVEKREPSPENQLLRGVHDQTTTYTIRVYHTGEGEVSEAKVVDYLPAGLEFLGRGGVDNTTNANGTQGDFEYPEAAPLSATTPPANTNAWPDGITVETVQATIADDGEVTEDSGPVYTKVTWDMGVLEGQGEPRDEEQGKKQGFPGTAGEAGYFELHYRAAVPLFENTMDFGGETPATDGAQASNLDNNRGASTRHGSSDLNALDPAGKEYTNHAIASGNYGGTAVSAHGEETIEAVDVRLVKTIVGDDPEADGAFTQNGQVRYNLNVRTSEYVSLSMPTEDGSDSYAHPYRLVDDLADGICPTFRANTPVTGDGEPRFTVLNAGEPEKTVTADDWNTLMAGSVSSACEFPSSVADAGELVGATLTGITFDSQSGSFDVDLAFDSAGLGELGEANGEYNVSYSAHMSPQYAGSGRADGATSSGDTITNTATIQAQTHSIEQLEDVESATGDEAFGDYAAWDDSRAELRAQLSGLTKQVLPREAGVLAADEVAASTDWVDSTDAPFGVGDQVWYKISVTPPAGADVRNPKLTDFLPAGAQLDEVVIKPSAFDGFGTEPCNPSDEAGWVERFVEQTPAPDSYTDASTITWELGSNECGLGGSDRFLPRGVSIDFFVKVTVTDQAAFEEVDLAQNLAKYQQENVDGDIFFLRDDAEVTLAQSLQLLKGIRAINDNVVGAEFSSNVDGRQVVQGDEVTFRIDITAPEVDSTGYVVWDALPEGIRAEHVDPTRTVATVLNGVETTVTDGWTSVALNPGDGGYPDDLDSAYKDRSVIRWELTDVKVPASTPAGDDAAVKNGVSLGYTITVPSGEGAAGALAGQDYVNTASVVSYENVTNDEGTVTLVPTGDGTLSTREAADGDFEVPAAGTVDDSDIVLPTAEIAKRVVSSEIEPSNTPVTDARNGRDDIVEGEYVTYEIAVEIPANTTVHSGVLADGGVLTWSGSPNELGRTLPYEFVEARVWNAPGVIEGSGDLTSGWAFDNETGILTFPEYFQTGDEDVTISVRLTAWIGKQGDPAMPDFADGKSLNNRASFASKNVSGDPNRPLTADATVTYRTPALQLSKTVTDPADGKVGADTPVQFELKASNGAGRPALYYVVVRDCVPEALTDVREQAVPAGTSAIVTPDACDFVDGAVTDSGPGTLITWTIPRISGGQTLALPYTVTVSEDAGAAASFDNHANLTGYTLPTDDEVDTTERRGLRTATAQARVTLADPVITKSVEPGAAPVGDTVTYTVTTTLPPNANFYDFTLTDTLPAGLEYVETTGMTAEWAGAANEPVNVIGSVSGQGLEWTFTTEGGAEIVDVATDTEERTLTVTYVATITDGVTAGAPRNTAAFAWNSVSGDDDTKKTVTDTADVTLLNPELNIAKLVDGEDAIERNPDAAFDYTLSVTNTGETAAHNITVVDEVPAGVIVDPASIEPEGGLADTASDGSGGKITWNLAGPLNVFTNGEPDGEVITLTYTGTFVGSEDLTAEAKQNVADVTSYESFEEGGWTYTPGEGTTPGGEAVDPVTDTATVTPIFPHVVPAKSVTDGAEAFVGEPFSWTIELENTGKGDAKTVTVTDTLPANWAYDAGSTTATIGGAAHELGDPVVDGGKLTWVLADAEGAPVLPAGGKATIVFTATPLEGALTEAGAGLSIDHTNTVGATATDTTGTEKPEYSGDDDTANAQIAAADLEIAKVAGGPLMAGSEGTGWTITVSNNGPDTASGPITVTDTIEDLPAGVTITGASGEGWDCSVPSEADGGATFTCEHANADGLAKDASLNPIEVHVQVAADQAPVEVNNSAEVTPGKTHDPDPDNNTTTTPLETITRADLTIAKTVATDEPTAGEAISWTLSPRNDGPTVSWVSDEAITITDVIPAGISGVADPSVAPAEGGAGWSATATNGFPAEAGDTITWTYVPATGTDWMPLGAAPQITLTGMIEPSWTGGAIENSAEITPGDTEDPNPDNNTSTVTVTPGDGTSITVAKTRVVNADGVWVAPGENDTVAWGEQVHYRIDVANNGPADARNVQVVDETPAGLTYAGHSDLEGTWTRTSGGTSGGETNPAWETFTLDGTQEVDQTRSFVVTFDTDSGMDPDTEIDNWVEARADNADPDRDDDKSGSTWRANLSLEKSHTGDAVAGETLDYTLLVTNHGPSTSAGPIVVTDELPAGFTYVPGTAQANGTAIDTAVSDDGRTLTWTPVDDGGTLAVNGTITITFTAAVDAGLPAQGGVVNTGTVDGPNDPDPSDDESNDPIDVKTSAVMSVTKDVADGPWIAGTEVEYTVTVSNEGPSYADGVRLADTVLDAGITLTSIAATGGVMSGWDCPADLAGPTTSATCVFEGRYAAGDTTTFTVTGLIDSNAPEMVEEDDPLVNQAVLSWTDSRGTHTDDDDAGITVSTLADLVVTKAAVDASGEGTGTFIAGEQGRYTITVHNDGPSAAVGPLTVTDTLPEGTTFDRVEGTDWTARADGQTVTFTREAGLASGGSAPPITFTVHVEAGVTDGTDLTNTATGESGTEDPNEENNTDTTTVQVDRRVDVTPSKTHAVPSHGIDEFEVGHEVDFTITATNAGPSHASGITITESLPAGLEFTGFAGDDWERTGEDPLEFTYTGVLAAGETTPDLTVRAEVTVEVGSSSEVTNEVCASTAETNTADDPCASDPVPVVPIADLAITKTVETGAEEINAGKPLTWVLAPRNLGPSASVSTEAGPITVTDTLPAGVAAITADPSTEEWAATTSNAGGWQQATAGDEVTWTFTGDAFEVGTEADIRLSVLLDAGWHDADIPNTAMITPGETRDPDEGNNSDDVTVSPADVTGLDVWKNRVVEVDGEWVPANSLEEVPPFNPGAPVSYEIAVANTGPADAREMSVVDAIPAGLSNPRVAQGEPEWTLAGIEECDGDMPTEGTDCATFAFGEVLRAGGAPTAFIVTFDTDPGIEGDVVNLAQARATNVPDEQWPTAEDSTGSSAYADLALTKTAGTGEITAGESVEYTIGVSNVGPSAARGPVTVTDTLPIGMAYTPGSAMVQANGEAPAALEPEVTDTGAGQVLTWQVTDAAGTLVPGDEVILTLTAAASDATYAPDGLVNVAVVDSPDDENPFNNEDSAAVIVGPKSELAVTKTAVGAFTVGSTGTYEITVENHGPTLDPGPIHVVDELPKGLTFASSPDPNADVRGNTVTWVLEGGLQVGERATLTLRVDVEREAYPSVTNVVTVTSDTPDESGQPQEASDEETVAVDTVDGASPPTGLAGAGVWALLALALLALGGGAVALRRRSA